MVLLNRCDDVDESMSQIVPSAGFTPPCDYSNFADTFDLSLLPGGDQATHNLYGQLNQTIPKIYTNFCPILQTTEKVDTQIELGPDFQKLLAPSKLSAVSESLYLEVPTANNYHANSPIGALPPHSPNLLSPHDFHVYHSSECYPNSPELSLYNSPATEDYTGTKFIKKENYSVGSSYYSENENIQLKDHNVFNILGGSLLDKQIKQESTVDFGNLLKPYAPQLVEEKKPKAEDHQLLREVLRDTSFQKKFNLKEIDFDFDIKMEESETNLTKDICTEQLEQGNIGPMLKLAITQVRKDIESTCTALNISQDPTQWTQENVLSWLQWTSREFNLPVPETLQWEISGASLVCLVETDFIRRAPQGGATLYAQLEIWKTAYLEDDLSMVWLPDATSNTSSGEVSDDEDEEIQLPPSDTKPATATTNTISTRSSGGSHIHLWQFLKELLAAPQLHGSCIRWLDRGKGVFKIEDSVRVARLWGKRKNRPAMNYDKLSRSIRQYYKKGIMKKTERSQRLVYQFCHPYCL